MSSPSDEIWNRALDFDVPAPLAGDLAVRRALTFHGMVHNGGLWYAIEVHAADEEFPLDAIAEAYRTLGLEATAEAVDRAAAEYEQTTGIGDDDAWAEAEERINEDYRIDDADISAAIERTLAQEPELFAPTD
ncbi:DMP19 family protein [Microbacterium oleivorans]|uniref:DMP19 family protein n=1 Tax=Microbacterium oleivorans TaxID=273677 RepID=UPI000766F420|nr:hypothetical protein [Microbacterium oleivorans]AZS43216.1 hypothetical protein BWL13_00764 [Microbacterium oleivorans]THE07794.1 hypothetical protein E1I21_05515 [Microbacterium oleivorans]